MREIKSNRKAISTNATVFLFHVIPESTTFIGKPQTLRDVVKAIIMGE